MIGAGISEAGLLLNVDKPVGWTSFRVVQVIRRVIQQKKIGHSGTLDPFASGVLLVCVGPATKKIAELMNLDKEYFGLISLDYETDSLDLTGTIVARSTSKPEAAMLQAIIPEFLGEIEQVPPVYSALKKAGVPYYKLARRGESVAPEKRKVTIHKIEWIDYTWPNLALTITCSKGTYIRSLARDLGRRAGCRAYLKLLKRTRIGSYKIEDALKIDKLIDENRFKSKQNG